MSNVFLRGELELKDDEFKSERAFIDLGMEDEPLVLEIGWLNAPEITPFNDSRDYFAYFLSVNGVPIEPLFAEPLIDGYNDTYFHHIHDAVAADFNGDGKKELLLYFPLDFNGGSGGGYLAAFSYVDGKIERLKIPNYLHTGKEDLNIKWLEGNNLSITSDEPAFTLSQTFFEAPFDESLLTDNDWNWADPVYEIRINNGIVKLYQDVCVGWHTNGLGDLITVLSWDENGNYIVDCRFEPYY